MRSSRPVPAPWLPAVALAAFVACPATPVAATETWSVGAGRSGVEATVDNVRDGSFAVFCPAGARRLELVLEVRRPGPRTVGDGVDVAFAIDGRGHRFPFRVTAALPTSATLVWRPGVVDDTAALESLLESLRRGRALEIRIADLTRVERFALRGSSVAIDRVVEECRAP